jgi:hypothetical protein
LTQYEIPSKRILQYDEFPIVRRLKLGEEEEIRENNLNYEYIFRNLIDTLNPMTPKATRPSEPRRSKSGSSANSRRRSGQRVRWICNNDVASRLSIMCVGVC